MPRSIQSSEITLQIYLVKKILLPIKNVGCGSLPVNYKLKALYNS